MSTVHELIAKGAPPSDVEAERMFIGGLLRWFEGFDDLDSTVTVDAFYHPHMRLIYAAMLELREDNEPVDALTVQARLKEKGQLKDVGEYTLAELSNEVLTGANIGYYAKIIVERHRQRLIIAAATDALRGAYSLNDSAELIARAECQFSEIEAGKNDTTLFRIPEVLDEVESDISRRRTEGRRSIGVTTGFIDLDAHTSGFCPGEMFVIGARPSQGKTAIAANMLQIASEQAPVLFVTLEMKKTAIIERMLASTAGVDSMKIRHASLSDDDMRKLRTAAAKIRGLPVWVSDLPGASLADIIHSARHTKRKVPDLAVVAVDYLQLIRPEKNQSEYEHISNVSRQLKGMARALNVCVVALSQLNRGSESRADKRPTMSDLRSSGQIEQDADVIALLHRPEQNDPKDRPGEADLIVCKVRNGPIGEITLTFDKSTTTFKNAATEWQTAATVAKSAEPVGGW